MTDTMPHKKVHHGRNVKRLREMLGIRQESLASELDMTQQNLSLLEQKEEIDEPILAKIANYLHISVEVIKNMNDDATINYINTFYDSSGTHAQLGNQMCYTINPIERLEVLYKEKVELYERMLKEKDDMIEKLMKNQK